MATEQLNQKRQSARTDTQKPEESHGLASQFESLANKVRDNTETGARNTKERSGHQTEDDSEQRKSNVAIRAAKERNDKANKESVETRTGEAEQRDTKEAETGLGLEAVKETLTSAARTAKDYAAPIAEKAKDIAVSTGETTAHYVGEKAVAAKDAAIQSGKVAAEYAGKAAEDLKDKAVVAGWSAAHYSCDTAVEGTKAAARLVKGAAESAGGIAAKPLSGPRDVCESTGESVKDYTARKKEEAQRESMYKETLRIEEEGRDDDDDGGMLGAIGETLKEKEIVSGGGGDEGQGYEKEHYQTATRKEHIA